MYSCSMRSMPNSEKGTGPARRGKVRARVLAGFSPDPQPKIINMCESSKLIKFQKISDVLFPPHLTKIVKEKTYQIKTL